MSVKTLTIDGKMVTGQADETIFDVAWNSGIKIPRLCHVGGVSDVGACRLCLVEVEDQNKLIASCMTQVQEGMVVHTQTDRLKSHRHLILELLFTERNHICSVCVVNGACELQDLAAAAWDGSRPPSLPVPETAMLTPVTIVSASITTAAFSARAASASATKWRAPTPGT